MPGTDKAKPGLKRETMAKWRNALTMAGIIPALAFMFVFSPILRAQADDLTLVPSALVPASGTFYSLQKADDQPPLPYDPFADLFPVFSLGDGRFLIDDRSVVSSSSIDPGDGEPGGDPGDPAESFAAFNYTCGL